MEIIITFAVVTTCFFMLSIGLILNGKLIRGSCGGEQVQHEEEVFSCGACPKKEAMICESDDDTGIARLAGLGNPNPDKH